MKKLLSIFTTVSLLTPTINSIISCSNSPKHDLDDDSNQTAKDIEILNNIKARVKKNLDEWWKAKATIDITEYPDQMEKFKELVTSLKTNDGQVLTGAAIREWRFLDQLYTGFETEFNNLNYEIKNEYSNYYINTVPLSLEANDISFTLQNIHFDNLAKLITVNNDNIMGITINFHIRYEVKFKDFHQRDEINGFVVICNDFEALSEIQKNLEKYFKKFVDDLFKNQNYGVVVNDNRDFNKVDISNTIWGIIDKALKEKEILFKSQPAWYDNSPNVIFNSRKPLLKLDSVLAWAGEGYDSEKLTVAKFLEFYKQNYFKVSIQENYYVKANLYSFKPYSFTIGNLPFNNNDEKKNLLTPIKVLLPKDFIDERLKQFAETTMGFWHYYQLETYNDKLVFKMTQTDYDRVLKATDSFLPNKPSLTKLWTVFKTIFEIFNETVDSKINHDIMANFESITEKVNLIKKTNSFIFEYFRWKDKYLRYPWNSVNFSYNSFVYSFFFPPNRDEENTNNPGEFLQTIEFKVV